MPTFIEYAARHNYEIVVGTGEAAGRPPAWGKVLLLQRLLREYDFVLWLDADIIIIDSSVDVASIVPQTACQALAIITHGLNLGTSPCTGVWALRGTDLSHRFLSEVWAQEDLIDHEHWEQTAALRTLGWAESPPYRKVTKTQWDESTHYLSEEWDMLPLCPIGYTPGFIRHYGGMPNAKRRMEMRTDLAGIAASRYTGIAKVHHLLRFELGRVGRAVQQNEEMSERLRQIRRLMNDPIGVLKRRLLAHY